MARWISSFLLFALLWPVAVDEKRHTPRLIAYHRIKPMNTEYDTLIKQAVERHLPGYDWRMYKAQLYQESKLNPKAVSPAGAGGIAQFMQATWEDVAPRAGYADADRFDPEASIMVGAFYMAELIKKWKSPRPEIDRHCLAMASYNAGFGNVLKAQKKAGNPALFAEIITALPEVTGAKNSQETTTYVRRILNYCNKLITGEPV